MDEWMDGWMDEWMPLVLSVPLVLYVPFIICPRQNGSTADDEYDDGDEYDSNLKSEI